MFHYIIFGEDKRKHAQPVRSWEHYISLINTFEQQQRLRGVRNITTQIQPLLKSLMDEVNALNLSDEQKRELIKNKRKQGILGELEKKKGEIKLSLVQCNFSGLPNPDGTIKGSKSENNLMFVEFDECDDLEATKAKILEQANNIHLALIYLSSSRKGYHIICERNFKYPYEIQQIITANLCGFKRDEAVKDTVRVAFQTSPEDIVFHNDALLFSEPPTPETKAICEWDYEGIDGAKWIEELPVIEQVRIEKFSNPNKLLTQVDFEGVKIEDIVEQLDEQYGGQPEVGERHAHMTKVASQLAPICGHNKEMMMEALPDYGKPEEEKEKVIDYVLENNQRTTPSDFAKLAIKKAKEKACRVSEMFEIPELPTNLPPIIKLFVDGVPERLKAPVAESIFAPLNTHLPTSVKFKYINGKYTYPCFLNLIVGGSAAGKDAITHPITTIMKTIDDYDKAARIAIFDAQKRSKKKGEQVEIPELAIQNIQPNVTAAAFLKLALVAEKHRKQLYTYAPEADNLRKMSLTCKTFPNDIIKAALDRSTWGAERVSADAVSGVTKLAFNFNAATQPNTAKALITGALLIDGTLSRLHTSIIPKQEIGADIEIFDGCDDDSANQLQINLQTYLEKLHNSNGIIDCKEAFEFQKKLVKQTQEMAIEYNSLAYDNLRKRALVIGYNKAMLLYILNDQQWSKDIEEYVEWAVNYDLACKMQIFGDAVEAKLKAENDDFVPQTKSRGSNTVLQYLPNEFTREDFVNCCAQHGCKNATQMICNYKRDNLIEQREDGKYVKKIA